MKYVTNELTSIGLNIFEEKMRTLASVWFNKKVPDKADNHILTLLGSYIFEGGAFGIKSQQEINSIIARNDNRFSLIRKVFPNRNQMIDYYGSILNKYPFLIPVYWIRLNCHRLFFNKQNTAASFKIMRRISEEPIRLTQELMDILKL